MNSKIVASVIALAAAGSLAGCTSSSYVATYNSSSAEPLQRIQTDSDFTQTVVGKRLSSGGVTLIVNNDGTVFGSGQAGKVSLNWDWRSGYFCRSGTVGGIAVTEDCEMVLTSGNTVHFVSNRGRGSGVEYRIR